MSESNLDPLSVPSEWHRYLYRSVLLEWETSLNQCKHFPRFNKNKPLAGVTLTKVDSIEDAASAAASFCSSPQPVERLVFYSKGTALKDLMGLIRNCVAHGHYSLARRGWINFHHIYQNKLKMTGQLKFANLKKLVAAITVYIPKH